MEKQRTEISELGEFGLIDHLSKFIELKQASTKKGIGDDAAVLSHRNETLVSSDLLMEGVHFDLSYTPLKHLGFKAIAVNVSDIAAMNAIPRQVLVNIGLSNRFSVEAIEEIYVGIKAACEAYGVDLVGGDTTSSYAGLTLSVTALGEAKAEDIVYRNGAKDKDIVCVTGDLGASFLGLKVLQREKEVLKADKGMQPDLEKEQYLILRHLKPEARTDIIHELRELGVKPNAMIDLSDGLASDIMHICKASGCGVTLFEENIPIDKQSFETAIAFQLDPITAALNGGEDYELCFTVSAEDFEKIEHLPDVVPVGIIHEEDKSCLLRTRGGQLVTLQAQGWTHF